MCTKLDEFVCVPVTVCSLPGDEPIVVPSLQPDTWIIELVIFATNLHCYKRLYCLHCHNYR